MMKKKVLAVIMIMALLFSMSALAQSEKTLSEYVEEANAGNALSAARVALAYGRGRGTERNLAEAEKWTEKAVELGYTHALYLMGVYYEEADDMLMADSWYVRAVPQFLSEANGGDKDGMYNLAICYKYGRGVPMNYVLASDWMKKSLEAGNEKAKEEYQLMQDFLNGEGGEYDIIKEANELYQNEQYADALAKYIIAAKKGFKTVINRIGVMYHQGEGTDKNEVEAVKWFQRGAHADDSASMCWIGYYYEHGFGGYPVNKDMAYEWYVKSLEAGCEAAQNFIDGLGQISEDLDTEDSSGSAQGGADHSQDRNDINSTNDTTAATEQGRRSNDLSYFADEKSWIEDEKLAVKGGFYNLTSDYDLILKTGNIRLEDAEGNIIKTVPVNTNYVTVVPHGGFVDYNFTVKDIHGGAAAYPVTDIYPVLEAVYTYEEHQPKNCPYCHDADMQSGSSTAIDSGTGAKRTCDYCKGTGTVECKLCDGTGRNRIYDGLSAIMKGRESPECENCGGDGLVECPLCHGDGFYD